MMMGKDAEAMKWGFLDRLWVVARQAGVEPTRGGRRGRGGSEKVLGVVDDDGMAEAEGGRDVDDALVGGAAEDEVGVAEGLYEGSVDEHIDALKEPALPRMGEDALECQSGVAPDGLAAARPDGVGESGEGLGLEHGVAACEGHVGERVGEQLPCQLVHGHDGAAEDVPRLGVMASRAVVGASGAVDGGAHSGSVDHRVVHHLEYG